MTKHGDGPSVSAQVVRPRGFWDRGTWDRGNTVNFDLNRSGTKGIPMPFPSGQCHQFKELPHNTAAHLAVPFPTSAACRFLDLPPGSADPFSLKTVHWTVFRALEPSKPSKSAIASVEKFTRQLTTLIARYFLKGNPVPKGFPYGEAGWPKARLKRSP